MKRVLFLLFLVAAMAAWCTPSFADPARETFAAPGPHTMTSIGALGGVDMTGAAPDTLNIGVAGTQTNVFSFNNPLGTATLTTIAISTDAASMSNIVFLGSSNVYGDIGTTGNFFLNIGGGATGETVTFLGTVYGTTLNVGAGAVNFNSGTTFDRITNTIFTASGGTITLAPGTLVTSILTTTAGAQTGTLNLGSGSQWTGAVGGAIGLKSINVVGGSNTAGVSAGITGAVDNYSFNLGTNTLNITGALTLHDTSIINTTLATPTVYGHIIKLLGITTLGATTGVNVTVPSTAYFPVGTKFYIVQSGAGPGTSVVAVTGPANYTFSADPPAGTTLGDITIKTDGIPMQASSNPAVPVLATLPVTPDLVNVLGPLNALSGQALDDATAQFAPSTPSLAAPLVRFHGIREFQNLWSSHLDMCSQASHPYEEIDPNCRGNEPHSGWWLKGFGYFDNQDARNGSTGYRSTIFGTMVAYDAPIGLNTRAGLGFGYARSAINGKTFDAETDSDTYQATAFIGHEHGPWFVNGSASLGWNAYSSMRHIVFPGVDRTANAKYMGQDYTAFVNTGYHFFAQKFTITPIASLQYSRMHLNGYTETGAGDVDLKVNSKNYDFLESGLGMKVERYFKYRGVGVVPEAHFNWFHEFSNPSLRRTARYTAAGSSSFTTPGPNMADDIFNVGAGLTLLSCACSATTWSLEAVYDHYWSNAGYSADQVMMRFTCRF